MMWKLKDENNSVAEAFYLLIISVIKRECNCELFSYVDGISFYIAVKIVWW